MRNPIKKFRDFGEPLKRDILEVVLFYGFRLDNDAKYYLYEQGIEIIPLFYKQ